VANAGGCAPQKVKVEESGSSSGNSAEARVRNGPLATLNVADPEPRRHLLKDG